MPRPARTTCLGISLVEMLVVVAIISIVLGLSFPMISAMRSDTSISAGLNTVAVSAASTRRYATENTNFPADLLPDIASASYTLGGQAGLYSGAAMIFTPSGEIRLTRNHARARSDDLLTLGASTNFLERSGPNAGDNQPVGNPSRELNGFQDIAIDYILLSSDTGVAGINRVSGGTNSMLVADPDGPPLLLPPPFAVWYDQSGYMVATGCDITNGNRPNDYQFVYYDGRNTGLITLRRGRVGSDRGSTAYDPYVYDPNSGSFDPSLLMDLSGKQKYELPFDKLEAVVGVYVYSKSAFDAAVDNGTIQHWDVMSVSANDDRWDWMRENGQMLMFSKQTGTLMRNRDE